MSKLKSFWSDTAPLVGDVVTWNGSEWMPASVPGGLTDTYTCPPTVVVGAAVYQNGLDSIDVADANDPLRIPCIGIVASKPDATHAVVLSHGPLNVFVGLTPIGEYYLDSTPGQIRVNAPASPSIAQKLGFAKNATTLVCMIDRDYVDQTL